MHPCSFWLENDDEPRWREPHRRRTGRHTTVHHWGGRGPRRAAARSGSPSGTLELRQEW